jgi:hypothetical protein
MTRRSFLRGLLLAGASLLLHGFGRKGRRPARDTGGSPPPGEPRAGGSWRPAYLELEDRGGLAERIQRARDIYAQC